MLPALIACALVLSVAVTPVPRADAPYLVLTGKETLQPTTLDGMVTQLGDADVVFVGENHDHKQGHALELTLLTELHRKNPKLLLSLEMFERDVQEVLDEYLADYITESSFQQAARPWPNYKQDYRPLIEYCKENRLPVIAANAPRRYVNIVSRKGQEALKPLPRVARAYLAPLPYSMDLPAGYAQQLDQIFGTAHGEDPHAKSAAPTQPTSAAPPAAAMPSATNMKEAQALWDATMADSIARALRRHPGHKVLQMNGCMHSDSHFGIADRLHRLMPSLKIVVVSIKPDPDYPGISPTKYAGVADYLIVTPAAPQTPPAQ